MKVTVSLKTLLLNQILLLSVIYGAKMALVLRMPQAQSMLEGRQLERKKLGVKMLERICL